MRLEWSRLRILDAVARTGSVNQAAVLLHLTGPAVSQQLRRIEREAGTRVVVADGRGLRLTDAGRTLADYARQVTELMQRAENDLQHDEVTGTVKIGAIASSIRDLLTPRLGQLGNAHPDIAVSIEDGETDDHLQRLADGHLDIVIAESWTNAPLTLPAGVVSTELTRQTAYVAAPSDHWAVSVTEVHIADLAAEVWSTCARDSRDHEALVQAGRTRGIELEVRHFVADPLTQLSLVAGGLALACLPYSTAPADTDEVVFRRLAPTTERTILLLTDDRVPARAVETVRDALLAG
ncbi:MULTISPECIES: LysR family transcriptional regulator [Brevibacterium]|uniref:DNA-binding transcriptional regulator, LysR family n=1 Tax=Brevibacterium linens TaxID=1703 RepID=A0A2H1K8S4_BRELN|nr:MULTISPECIES: LysR family transcriptional regulator [Brevibacterium]MCU4296199.1 LysR family transcriptional regulator [Brevibacterium permense]SMX95954.1 DNA-binding transcriptional regulator, LysR family [Brevibacterium linens]